MIDPMHLITIPLTKQTYRLWYKQAEDCLIAGGFEDLIEKEYIPVVDETKKKNDRVNQRKAMSTIRKTLSQENQLLVINCDTLKEMLGLLKVANASLETPYHIQHDLQTLHWGFDPAEVFFSRLNDIRSRLISIQKSGQKVEDGQFVSKVLDEMPAFMEHVKNMYTLKINGGETLDFANFCTTVINDYNDPLKDSLVQQNSMQQTGNQQPDNPSPQQNASMTINQQSFQR